MSKDFGIKMIATPIFFMKKETTITDTCNITFFDLIIFFSVQEKPQPNTIFSFHCYHLFKLP